MLSKYENLDWKYKKIINYSLLFQINYHTLGGIRHLVWDKYPNLLKNSSVKKSSFILFGGSFILSYIEELLV